MVQYSMYYYVLGSIQNYRVLVAVIKKWNNTESKEEWNSRIVYLLNFYNWREQNKKALYKFSNIVFELLKSTSPPPNPHTASYTITHITHK